MLNPDLVKSICAIFLHDGQPVTPDHAAELLGWTLAEMDRAIKWGDIELDPTTEDARISRAELIEKATHQWPFSVIQEALGPNAVNVFPAGLLMRPLIIPVHEYADAMLEYFAKKGNESKENVLGRILDDYAAQHITELVANVPVFNDAASFMGEAKHTAAADPVSVHVARAARVGGRSARTCNLIAPPAVAAMPPAPAPSPAAPVGARATHGCDRPSSMVAVSAGHSVIRDHGGASVTLAPSVPALTAPLPPLMPYVPESPSKRRRRLGAHRPSGEPLQTTPEPARRNRPDGIREATLSSFELGYQRFVPFLRLRGQWLASLGFKARTRIYINASQGRLVITVDDPANARERRTSPAEPPATLAALVTARVARRRGVTAAAAAGRGTPRSEARMRHYRNAAESIDVAAIINAGLALRDLAKADAHMHDVFTSFVHEALTDGRRHSASIFITAAVVYMERAQRVAWRFRTWRASKCAVPPLLGEPDPIGTQNHPVRRWRGDSFDVNAVLSTVLAVRALDREEATSHERGFVATLSLAYDGWTSPFIRALLAYAERDRRFARRFRSWRRAKAARAASAAITPPPSGSRSRRKTR